jgi:ATP-dependent Clp protease ATP-binding subunit ClpC
MFERFTEAAIKVLMLAQEEGRRLGHNFVDSEQVMLGLLGEGKGIAAKALKLNGVTLKAAREQVETVIGRGHDFPRLPWYRIWFASFKEMPFKPRTKRIFELSSEEANQLGVNYISTEHLLLGLIREEKDNSKEGGASGVAGQTLHTLGVDLKILEAKVRELIEERTRG